MTATLLAIAPSYWQQVAAGLAVVLTVALPLGVVLEYLRLVVFVPRAAGRRWPEGAGWGGVARIPAEVVVDLQRVAPAVEGRDADLADVAVSVRVGLALATFTVIPLSTGLVVVQPHLGVFLFPVLLAGDAAITAALWVRVGSMPRADAVGRAAGRVGGAALLGLVAGAVAVQWGSASMTEVVAAQAHARAFGIAGWGVPTALVQLPALLVAATMLHVTGVALSPAAAEAPLAGSRGVIERLAASVWIVAGAAWLVACFAGGGAVPWDVSNDGVRHVLSATLFLAKLALVGLVMVWARATWPEVTASFVRRALLVGAAVAVGSIGVTSALQRVV